MLPIRDPETLLLLEQREGTSVSSGFSYQQYVAIRDHTSVVDLAAYARARLNVTIDGQPEPTAEGQMVSGGYFPLLGVVPAAGRALGPDDDRVPLGHPVAMISHGYWKRRFGLDPAILGRTVVISGTSFTIVGVTPPEFFGAEVGTSPDHLRAGHDAAVRHARLGEPARRSDQRLFVAARPRAAGSGVSLSAGSRCA